jgi:hypothetical protein
LNGGGDFVAGVLNSLNQAGIQIKSRKIQ